MIVYCAADLLWSTKIQGTGKAIGIVCRPVRTVEMLKARLADSDVRAAIVDLDNLDMALDLLRALRGEDALDPQRRIRTVAFGPHVEVALFDQAKQAGADVVLARGAFDRRLSDLLNELDAPTPEK